MEKQTIKEIGKLLTDFAKIVFAIAVLMPLVKGNTDNLTELLLAVVLMIGGGIFLINRGERDE